jgi:hypothetical protein
MGWLPRADHRRQNRNDLGDPGRAGQQALALAVATEHAFDANEVAVGVDPITHAGGEGSDSRVPEPAPAAPDDLGHADREEAPMAE